MNANTTGRRRYQARAAAITTIAAVIFGAAACGTEKASDGQQPAAPAAPAPKVQSAPHAPSSADSAERRAYEERIEQYRRHYGSDQHRD